MNSIPIVAVGYNRAKSLARLLSSLSKADYLGDDVPLIISIDRCDTNQDVLAVANNFVWQFGEKIIRYQAANLGLRKHILQCGDLALKYGNIIVLEDDLYVSPLFYSYARQASEFYQHDDHIGGVSLYSHSINVGCGYPFLPLDDGYDNYFFQFASSWGQLWSKQQWQAFRNWYQQNDGPILRGNTIPDCVASWKDSSWLKYYIKYLIDTGKYFVYPRVGLTTNFSDVGTHAQASSTDFQIPLQAGTDKDYRFSSLDNSQSIYDAFFENTTLAQQLAIGDVCLDYYGLKGNREAKRYWLTSIIADYKIVASYALALRPYELNVLYNCPGAQIFLYDTEISEANPLYSSKKLNKYRRICYNYKCLSLETIQFFFLPSFNERFVGKIKRILKKISHKG